MPPFFTLYHADIFRLPLRRRYDAFLRRLMPLRCCHSFVTITRHFDYADYY